MSQHRLPSRHRPKMGQWSSFRRSKQNRQDNSEHEYGFASEEFIIFNQQEKERIEYGYGSVSEEMARPISRRKSKQLKKDNIDNSDGSASEEKARATKKISSKKHKQDSNDYGYEDHTDYGYGHASAELTRPTHESTNSRRTKSLERPRRRNSIVRPPVDQLPCFDDDLKEKPTPKSSKIKSKSSQIKSSESKSSKPKSSKPKSSKSKSSKPKSPKTKKPKSMSSILSPPKPKSMPSMFPLAKAQKAPKEQEQRPRRSLILAGPLKRLSSFRIYKTKSHDILGEEKKEEDTRNESWDDGTIKNKMSPHALRRRSTKDAYLMESPRLEKELMKRNTRRGRRSELRRKLSEKLMLCNNGSSSTHLDFSERDSTGRNSCKLDSTNITRVGNIEYEDDDDDCIGTSITSSVVPSHNLKDEEVMLLLYRELQTMEQ